MPLTRPPHLGGHCGSDTRGPGQFCPVTPSRADLNESLPCCPRAGSQASVTEGTFSRGVHGAGAKTEFQAGSWRGVGACPPPQGRGGPVPRAGTRLLQSPLLDARPHQAGERYVSPESAVNLPGSREGDRDARDSAGLLPAAARPPYSHRRLCGPGSGDHGDRADSPRALSVTSATPPLPLPPARQPGPQLAQHTQPSAGEPEPQATGPPAASAQWHPPLLPRPASPRHPWVSVTADPPQACARSPVHSGHSVPCPDDPS